jgi:hypothetical protein
VAISQPTWLTADHLRGCENKTRTGCFMPISHPTWLTYCD